MALRRSRDVNNMGLRMFEKFPQVSERQRDCIPLAELLRHERLCITCCDKLASGDPPDLRGMRISDFSATDDGNLKHGSSPGHGVLWRSAPYACSLRTQVRSALFRYTAPS